MKNQKREGRMCPFHAEDMKCPRNANGTCLPLIKKIVDPKTCQIITPKKKKSGVVRVKGWAYIYPSTNQIAEVSVHDRSQWTIQWVPITILVNRKYIGGKNAR